MPLSLFLESLPQPSNRHPRPTVRRSPKQTRQIQMMLCLTDPAGMADDILRRVHPHQVRMLKSSTRRASAVAFHQHRAWTSHDPSVIICRFYLVYCRFKFTCQSHTDLQMPVDFFILPDFEFLLLLRSRVRVATSVLSKMSEVWGDPCFFLGLLGGVRGYSYARDGCWSQISNLFRWTEVNRLLFALVVEQWRRPTLNGNPFECVLSKVRLWSVTGVVYCLLVVHL